MSAVSIGVESRARGFRRSGRAQALLFLGAFAMYRLAYGFTSGAADTARAHGASILSLERATGLAIEPGVQNALHPVIGVLTGIYVCAQLLVIWLVLAWLWQVRRRVYRRLRATVMATWLVGVACFAAWPAAPPRFVGAAGVSNSLADAFGNTAERATAIYNPYAAMPSLHCAFALLAGLAIWRAARGPWRLLGLAWPTAVATATVATGNHWLLDVVAGFAIAAGGWAGSGRLARD